MSTLDVSHVVVVRHACAGAKKEWEGVDLDRPLDAGGIKQSLALVPVLARAGVQRLMASPPSAAPRHCNLSLAACRSSWRVAGSFDVERDGAAAVATSWVAQGEVGGQLAVRPAMPGGADRGR